MSVMTLCTTEGDQIPINHVLSELGFKKKNKSKKMHPVEALLITITVILLFIQFNQQQFVVFRMMFERWSNECLTV